MKKLTLLIPILLLTACFTPQIQEIETEEEVVRDIPLTTDWKGAKVEKEDLLQGCFAQDCIPSIQNPTFDSAETANTWLKDDDVVFAINHKNVQRAYPQRILNWHEIVNDVIEEDPVAITFCPLCGSALAFERKVDGIITEFGVSGKLHNSDLVMYDRYEGSMWQQVTGEAIVGPAAQRNEVLTQLPISTTTWGQWKSEFPETEVLSTNTGFTRDYSAYPYGTYESNDELIFGIPGGEDKSLQIKTVVYGIELHGAKKAYTEELLKSKKVLLDTFAGTNIKLQYLDSGQVKVTNLDTQEGIIPIRLFWFAWAAFNPDTDLYK